MRKKAGDRPNQSQTWKVAVQILRYLNEHPDAADTANGIIEWWLLKQSISEAEDVVKQALDMLIDRNLINFVTSADGRKHYYFNVDETTEARKLIRGKARED
jgi:Fe2+ or Zn2+ uptake regulation protein